MQNIKIYPYNYIWLNNLASITNVSKNFELDYWGVASKEIASHLMDKDIIKNECIVSNRNRGIKDFILKKDICFIPFKNLHTKKERPFYVILTERSLSKGLPNNCQNIYNEKISINFSKEELILGKVFKCT